jgi:hypothetical protein
MVREKLAALLTHDQVAGMIREVREDIRELKRTGQAYVHAGVFDLAGPGMRSRCRAPPFSLPL